jgi:hypothetical protein
MKSKVMTTPQKAHTMSEIKDLAKRYGQKCWVWVSQYSPGTKSFLPAQLKQMLASVVYDHLSKDIKNRPRFFKGVYSEDKKPKDSLTTALERLSDSNSLSDPALIEKLEQAGFVKKNAEPAPDQKPQMTDEELVEYLKAKGVLHGKVKAKNAEPEPEPELQPSLEPEQLNKNQTQD